MRYKSIIATVAALAAIVSLQSCKEHYVIYDDAEYIMFADTAGVYPVRPADSVKQADPIFEVPVVSTVTRNYDRTFAVEIIDKRSSAVEGLHYNLKSNTITIPAGENKTSVEVVGVYDEIKPEDQLSFQLKLVMDENLVSPMYGDTTNVQLMKICPFDIKDFTGWCLTTSMFLFNFHPQKENQRLVHTELHPTEENTIILHDWLYDGYDINIRLDNEDDMAPLVLLGEGQVISDEGSVFGIVRGDDRIQCRSSRLFPSYFYPCGKYLFLWTEMYVEKYGELVGSVGNFYNVIEWISDEEAERLQREQGF